MDDSKLVASDVSFGAWIQERRKALDLTQNELAGRVGCSLSTIRKIESDERRPSRQMAELLAEHLALPPDQHERFLQVARAQLPVDRLPPSTDTASERQQPPSNLPLPPAALVGREPELEALSGLLREPECRLLTLVGTGGIGKTRLAIEVASQHQHAFPDGTYFVPLASLNSPVFLVSTIADALDFALQGSAEPRVRLLNYLSPKKALIVLDNVEHLLAGVELFAEILEQAPGVKLLTTSRERLNLRGEWIVEVQGLPVPPIGQTERPEQYSAVALFTQNAQRVQTDFELRPEDQLWVGRICQMVDGMPLGIELAAAWVPLLSCREIASEIGRSLDFLTTSMRDVPERQRSLRAVFEHSWNLLSVTEQNVLCRLAVFRGGFSREAAEQVAGATLSHLSALSSKSLVHRMENGRFDLHEVVRQYAESHLAAEPAAETEVRDRHCIYYLALWRDREAPLRGAAQQETIRELTNETYNGRAAWAWALQHEKFALIGQVLRCLGWLCDIRGWLREGIRQSEPLVKILRGRPATKESQMVLGQALTYQGSLTFRLGRHDQAQALFEESLALLRPLDDPSLLPDPLIFFGIVMYLNGNFDRARSLLDEGLACAQIADDLWFTALAQFNLGYMDSCLGRHSEAYEQMAAALLAWRRLGDPRMVALGLNYLGPVVIQVGRLEEAQVFLQESLALTTELGDRWGMGTAYRHLGLTALAQGNIAEAEVLIRKSLDLFAELETHWDKARSLICLGQTMLAAGNRAEAKQVFGEALRLGAEIQAVPVVLDALLGLAHLQARHGKTGGAMELSYCVASHLAGTQDTRDRAGQLLASLESQLSAQEIEAIRAQARPFEALVAAVLEQPG